MLSDRGYIKDIGQRRGVFGEKLTAIRLIIYINVLVFLFGSFCEFIIGNNWLVSAMALSGNNIGKGFVWTLLTYGYLHNYFWHILANMLVLFFIGPHVEARLGFAKTLVSFNIAVLVSGLFWLLSTFVSGRVGILEGASGGAFAIFALFCMLEEDRKMTFLLFFVKPVDIRPRVLLAYALGFELFGFLFFEIIQKGSTVPFAFSGHLGGALTGILLAKFYMGNFTFSPSGKRIRKIGQASDYSYTVNIQSDIDLKAEVNRILDKINAKGFSSLTDKEKDILNVAKDRLK